MSEDTPTMGRFEGRAHLLPVRIYYEDTDFSGLVYHANYLRYCERGRSDYLRAAGVDHTALLESDSPTAFAVLALNMKFLKPARIDDALIVRTTFDTVKGARMTISQSILRGDETLLEARVEACCISLAGRPKRAPGVLVERLQPYLDQPASRF